MSLPKIVVVEGTHGVGKTTFCEALGRAVGAELGVVRKTPPIALRHSALTVRPQGGLAAFCIYMAGNALTCNETIPQPWLILDRYVLSTFVGHRECFSGMNINIAKFIDAFECRAAAATVLLRCKDEIIVDRLRTRGEGTNSQVESLSLVRGFDEGVRNPSLIPYLGETMELRSESEADLARGVERVLEFVRSSAGD